MLCHFAAKWRVIRAPKMESFWEPKVYKKGAADVYKSTPFRNQITLCFAPVCTKKHSVTRVPKWTHFGTQNVHILGPKMDPSRYAFGCNLVQSIVWLGVPKWTHVGTPKMYPFGTQNIPLITLCFWCKLVQNIAWLASQHWFILAPKMYTNWD